jgi:PAS domain S-box-containing protein
MKILSKIGGVSKNKRAEAASRERERRLLRQNDALVNLARSETVAAGDLKRAVQEITEMSAYALETERTSVWLFDDLRSKIRSIDLYERTPLKHSEGAELLAKDYPSYFEALQKEHTIAAHEAHTDPRTREFSSSYLTPLGISSMLDAPIRLDGKMVGVLCHEHVGPARHWTLDEQNFAGSVADLVSLSFEKAERKRVEDNLRRSEEYYRSLIENALDVVTIIDAEGILRYQSPSAERVLGYKPEEVIGKRGRNFFHPDDVEYADSVLKQFLANPNKPVYAEFRVLHKNGSYRTMQFIGKNLLGNAAVAGIVVNYRDVTETRIAEKLLEEYRLNLENKVLDRTRELNEKNVALQDALGKLKNTQQELVMHSKMAALGGLVAGVAHEVNNPIGAVNSAADVSIRCVDKLIHWLETSQSLEELKSNPQFCQVLDYLKENNQITATAGSRIAKIVRSLKNFARLDEAEFQEANLHEGIESTLTLVHHELKNKATVIKEFGELPLVYCYPNQLNQVFMNLFVNAAQAIEKEGSIKIKTFSNGSHAFVKISDTGKGIPPENLPRIFDPGFTTKGVGVGTGLGLSISYNIIQKHKGEIKVESVVGEGAEFTIRLPIRPQMS